MSTARQLARGLIAGAAGTVALNVTTYLDMALRARPASSVPAQTAQEAADEAGVDLARSGDKTTLENRSQGLGALMGYAAGLGFGALHGVLHPRIGRPSVPVSAAALTLGAMAGANLPATLLGVTDPTEWGPEAWAGDIIPHVIYGVVTAAVHDAIRL